MIRQKVTPFLWFDNQAEEAANIYVSLFPDSAVTRVTRGPTAAWVLVEFRLAGAEYFAFDGGPHFKLNEAFSLSIDCRSQAELDDLWEKLSDGGSEGRCGWVKDRYGLSWQLVPSALLKLLSDPDHAKAGRVMEAMMGMKRLDIRALEEAAGRKS